MGRWLIIQGCNYSTIETNRPYTVVGKEQNHETGDENPLWRKEGGVYIYAYMKDCPFPSPLRRGRFSNIIEISSSCFSQSSRWSSRSSCKRSQMRRIPARVIQCEIRSRLEFGIPGSWDKWEGTEFSVACVLGQERRSKDSVAPRRLKKSLHSSFGNRILLFFLDKHGNRVTRSNKRLIRWIAGIDRSHEYISRRLDDIGRRVTV